MVNKGNHVALISVREREREGDKKPAQEIKNYEAVGYLANWDRVSGCARVWGLGCGPRLLTLWLYLHIYTVLLR